MVLFYTQLLTRVFDIMRAKNPEMVTGEKKKFVMKPPQVMRIGTKKTSFANFTDICKMYVNEVSVDCNKKTASFNNV